MSGKEEVPPKVLTKNLFILGIVLAFLWTYLSIWNVAIWTLFPAREWNWGLTWNGLASGGFLLLILLALLQLPLPERFKLKPQQMVIIFAFGMGSVLAASFRAPGAYLSNYFRWRIIEPLRSTWLQWVPEPGLWSPSEEICRLALTGGVPIPAEWIAPLLFWMAFAIAGIIQTFGLFAVELANIAQPWEGSATGVPIKLRPRVKVTLIGIIVGFLFYLPFLLRALFPWFPSIYGWETWPFVPWHPGALDLNRAIPAINTILPGSWGITLYPLFWSLSILAPTSVSLSTGLTWLVLCGIAPAICYYTGLYPVTITTMGDHHTVFYFIAKEAPLKLGVFGVVGAGLALAILPFIFEWKYWVSLLKAAVGLRPMTDEEKRSEPWHLRWSFLMFIIGFIIQMAMAAILGANVLYSIIGWLLLVLIGSITVARGAGEMGWFPEYSDYHGALVYNICYPDVTMDNMTTEYVRTMMLWGGRNGGHVLAMAAHGVQPPVLLATFKMAHVLKVPTRDTMIAYFVGALISVLFGWPLFLWLCYTYGINNLPGLSTAFSWGGYISTIHPASERAFFELPILPWIVAGFVVVGFLMVMSRRFVWWPIAPIGVFLGLCVTGWAMGAASSGLFGYIVKTIILRVGGARVYDEKAVPFVSGLTGGLVLTCILMYAVIGIRTLWPGII